MLEKRLLEEVARYKAINNYTKKLMMEQDAPPPATAPEETPPPAEDPEAGLDTPPPADDAAAVPPPADAGGDLGGLDDTQEMDITDLVNMTTSIKKDLEAHTQDNGTVIAKMDDVFGKLGDLEQKLSQMDSVIAKIDQMEVKMDAMKEKTPEEKLEMRSLDSYPFNQNPQQFFAKKQADMRSSGKNEYVLTKGDVQNYSTEGMKNSFNPEDDENM
jgi:hypothetical protein